MRKLIQITLLAGLVLFVFGSSSKADPCWASVNCDTITGVLNDTLIWSDSHPVREAIKHSVVMIADPDGTPHGTGMLINSYDCNGSGPKPYVITAWHVFKSATRSNLNFHAPIMDSVVFYFNYDLPCDSGDAGCPSPDTTEVDFVRGASYVAIIEGPGAFHEPILLELKTRPEDAGFSSDVYYTGWTRDTIPPDSVFGLSHPVESTVVNCPMGFHADFAAPTATTDGTAGPPIWIVDSVDVGYFGQGSSGSTLLSFSNSLDEIKIIGTSPTTAQHSACPSIPLYDQFSAIWDHGCCFGSTGDANGDHGANPSVADISAINDYLFITGTPPTCFTEADVNADGAISTADVSRIVDFLFVTGTPLPSCDSANAVKPVWKDPFSEFLDPNNTDSLSIGGWHPDSTHQTCQ